MLKRKRALEREQKDVKGQADRLLNEWTALGDTGGRTFLTQKLNELADRREQLTLAIREVEEALTYLETTQLSAEQMQLALSNLGAIYEHLKPYEQKELFRLVLARAEVSEHKLKLALHNEALHQLAEGSGACGFC